MNKDDQYLTSVEQAQLYNKFRPSPPQKLISRIIEFLKVKFDDDCLASAIDVGCGSGQSTSLLASYFKRVIGIDNCGMQISLAESTNCYDNVQYKLGEYCELGEPNESLQLVCACQSAHFFDMDRFYKEAERVLVYDGVLAIFGYSLPIPFSNGILLGDIIQEVFNIMGPYISNHHNHVYIHRYSNAEFQSFPFCSLDIIREYFENVEEKATVFDLIGHVESWSAYKNLKKSKGDGYAASVMSEFQEKILAALHKKDEDPANVEISIKFPYILLMGRKS